MYCPGNNEIQIEYDKGNRAFYIVWEPVRAIGSGKTEREALEDLRAAAHFGIEAKVNDKLRAIEK